MMNSCLVSLCHLPLVYVSLTSKSKISSIILFHVATMMLLYSYPGPWQPHFKSTMQITKEELYGTEWESKCETILFCITDPEHHQFIL